MEHPEVDARPSTGPEFKVPESERVMEEMIKEKGADKAPRVTADSIAKKIAAVLYSEFSDGVTICKITMHNGFSFVDMSAPASPENYDKEIGRKIAYERAFKQIWGYEGYLLKETLFQLQMLKHHQGKLAQAQAALEDKAPDPTDSQAALGNPAHD